MHEVIRTIRPDLNLNGSGRENLLEDKTKQVVALSELIEALKSTGPHPRDYQMPGFYYTDARELHNSRITLLETLLNTLRKEQSYIVEGNPE